MNLLQAWFCVIAGTGVLGAVWFGGEAVRRVTHWVRFQMARRRLERLLRARHTAKPVRDERCSILQFKQRNTR